MIPLLVAGASSGQNSLDQSALQAEVFNSWSTPLVNHAHSVSLLCEKLSVFSTFFKNFAIFSHSSAVLAYFCAGKIYRPRNIPCWPLTVRLTKNFFGWTSKVGFFVFKRTNVHIPPTHDPSRLSSYFSPPLCRDAFR